MIVASVGSFDWAPRNVASAYSFLYPFVGLLAAGDELYFCLTTSPAAAAGVEFHGAFRSRDVTREAFYCLMDLLRYVGHPVPRHRCRRLGSARHSATFTFSTVMACVGQASTHAGIAPASSRGLHMSHLVTMRRSGWKAGTE